MALNTKINVPISTPIISGQTNNNFAGEIAKIQELVANTNRSNEGNISWTSSTSNITYNTSDYQSFSDIYGKGETGLYNLLIYQYGELVDGWIVTAEDWNSLIEKTEQNTSSIEGLEDGSTPAINSSYAAKIGTAASHPAIGSAVNPVYVSSNGTVTASNGTAGADNRPVYLTDGVLTAMTGALPTTYGGTGNTTGTAAFATTAADTTNTLYLLGVTSSATTALKRNTGVSMKDGTITASISGNASTASKLATARSLKVALDSTTAVTFDGSAAQDNIPISGTLAVGHGGTGATTAAAARTNLGLGSVSTLNYGSDTTKYLRNDGTWVAPTGTYSLPIAKYNTLGGVKPAYTSTNNATLTTAAATNTNTPTIAAKTTTSGRYYAVEADKNGYMYVNVPWTDNNTTYSAGTGISLSGTQFSNSGVRAVSISGNNLRVNTNGTNADLTIPYATSAGSATTATSATSATSATTATTATKLGSSNVGGTAKPIYLDGGTPKAISSTVGGATTPIYSNAGTLTACTYSLSATVNSGTANKLAYYSGTNAVSQYSSSIGSGTKPMYLNAGVPTASNSTVGSKSQLVYMNSGTLTGGIKITYGTSLPSTSSASAGDVFILVS